MEDSSLKQTEEYSDCDSSEDGHQNDTIDGLEDSDAQSSVYEYGTNNVGKYGSFLRDGCIINRRQSTKKQINGCKTSVLENTAVLAGYRCIADKYAEETFSSYNRRNSTCIETDADGTVNKITYTIEEKVHVESTHYYSLLEFDKAPEHMRFNKYIRYGYRGSLPSNVCINSIFWLTNESVNIWTHLFGWLLFLGLTFYDLLLLNFHASVIDKLIVGGMLLCFQFCMITSALYHTFSCHSEDHFNCFLKYDLLGIVGSLLAIYLSGIYYAFWCHVGWCKFYISTVFSIFVVVLIVQLLDCSQRCKLTSFLLWAAYGVVPTLHWTVMMGGWENPIVEKLLPRVINMYLISGAAFAVYASYIPERFFPGRFDFFGSSHQIWHMFVVIALYYWHNTGINYIEYRMSHGCFMTDCSDYC